MSHTLSAQAHRIVISALATFVVACALPQAGFAHSALDTSTWKVDPAKSRVAPWSDTVTLERNGKAANPDAKRVMIISDGKVYLATGAAAADALAGKRLDPRKLVQIGQNARSTEPCYSLCQRGGFGESRMTVTFQALAGGQQKATLAYGKPQPVK